jgi:hypothetical protein
MTTFPFNTSHCRFLLLFLLLHDSPKFLSFCHWRKASTESPSGGSGEARWEGYDRSMTEAVTAVIDWLRGRKSETDMCFNVTVPRDLCEPLPSFTRVEARVGRLSLVRSHARGPAFTRLERRGGQLSLGWRHAWAGFHSFGATRGGQLSLV